MWKIDPPQILWVSITKLEDIWLKKKTKKKNGI